MEKRKANKIIWSIIIIIISIIGICRCEYKNISTNIPWNKMTYEQKDTLLNEMLNDKDFNGIDGLDDIMKEKLDSAYSSYTIWQISPSPYNKEFSQVLEADSGWISTIFKGSFRNYYNKRIYFTGGIIYQYHPSDKSLTIKKWDSAIMKDPDGPEE